MSEQLKHWAEDLQVGDKCLATIRHKTDGQLNQHNVILIVVENHPLANYIVGYFINEMFTIDYNELNPYHP